MSKLVLFDIDGTLIKMQGISRRSLLNSFFKSFSINPRNITYNMSGQLDSKIIEEFLLEANISKHAINKEFDKIKASYIENFIRLSSADQIKTLSGVEVLLEKISRFADVSLGLLTGNFEKIGRHKLALKNLNHYFPFGTFAEDGKHRNDLPAVAVKRAKDIYGNIYKGKDVIIIGDTEHDIKCAKVLDSKSIAVSTGRYSSKELSKHHPDVLLDDFSNIEKSLELILN